MAASAYFDAVQKLYIAYYGRPADTVGLTFWAEKVDAAGGKIEDVVDAFGNSAEAQTIYGDVAIVTQVNNVFKNILGRDADVDGLNFYANKVANGEYSLASLAQRILDGATTGTDAQVVANKLAAAKAFTAAIDTAAEVLAYTGDTAAQQARDFLAAVTADAATVPDATEAQTAVSGLTGAEQNPGQTFTLTTGADVVVGTASNDTINALSIKTDGAGATTFSAFDAIDGGAGVDTLNIYTTDEFNTVFPANTTVKNVEIVNIHNAEGAAALADASKFEGVEQLWQIGAAANVTKLAATTTAGFRNVDANIAVAAADAAATAKIALDNLGEGNSITVTSGAAGTLNSVTVAGTVKDTNADKTVAANELNITVGKDVESLSVNTANKTTLTVNNGAGTKTVSAVDASASAGAVTYNAANTVANVKTGAGDDVVTLNTRATATSKTASVATGAGKDTVNVFVNANGQTGVKATADAGAGDDEINVNNTGLVGIDIKAGAGNDTVTLVDGLGSLASTDKVDGGEGTDTLVVEGKTLDAEDYIILNEVTTGFEAIEFTTKVTADASRMSGYKTIETAASANAGDVAAAQAEVNAAQDLVDSLESLNSQQTSLEEAESSAQTALDNDIADNGDVATALTDALDTLAAARALNSDAVLNTALVLAENNLAADIAADGDVDAALIAAEDAQAAAQQATADAEAAQTAAQQATDDAEAAQAAAQQATADAEAAQAAAQQATADAEAAQSSFASLVTDFQTALASYVNNANSVSASILVTAYNDLIAGFTLGNEPNPALVLLGNDDDTDALTIYGARTATASAATAEQTELQAAVTDAQAAEAQADQAVVAAQAAEDQADQAVLDAQAAEDRTYQAVLDAQAAEDQAVQAVQDADGNVIERTTLFNAVTTAQGAVDDRDLLIQDVADAQAAVELRNDLIAAEAAAQNALDTFNAAHLTLDADLATAQGDLADAEAALDDILETVAAETSVVTKVAADQALVANGSLNATAAGYVLDSDTVTAGNQTTYAGSLNITAQGDGNTITAQADSVSLKVAGLVAGDVGVTLTGDVKSATVALTNGVNNAKAELATEDTIASVNVTASGAELKAMTTLTLTGNGQAAVTNVNGSALVTVDASALGGTYALGADKGDTTFGLDYFSNSAKAETVKLGSGIDWINLQNSTVKNMDTVTGLNLVDNADVTGKQIDFDLSDVLMVNALSFEKVTVEAASLNLALIDLAASATKNEVVFTFGGDTYIYADNGTDANFVDDADVLVKVTGSVDLDLLVSSLNGVI